VLLCVDFEKKKKKKIKSNLKRKKIKGKTPEFIVFKVKKPRIHFFTTKKMKTKRRGPCKTKKQKKEE
jgi:hypothetical protein